MAIALGAGALVMALLQYSDRQAEAPKPAGEDYAYLRASAAFHGGDFEEALRQLEPLSQRTPEDARVWVTLGEVYLAVGRLKDAAAAYERATSLDAKRAQSWSRLGVLRAQLGDVKGGRAALEKALALNPRDTDALEQRAELEALEGRVEPAVKGLLEAAGAARPAERPSLFIRAGELLVEADRAAEAARLLRQAKEAGVTSPELLAQLAEWELRAGSLEAAADAYREAAIAAKKDPTLWFVLGELLVKLGKPDEAAQAFRQSLQVEPRASTHVALGKLALTRKDRAGAEQSLAAAAESLSTADAREVMEIAELLTLLGREKDAVQVLASVAAEAGEAKNVELQRRLAALAKKTGDRAALTAACERVQAADAGSCP